ncbi:leucine-rich repeat-containing protein 20 isoform X6 [Latimeria chalumnae]|uniref:leucine-rich repeat-containing protein 20 isoform X6 n=1 Tax=Latimeria chalumnae TaxID=7897 RepID=UPI0003C13609|nr:PREDICTED: leucine-rich repeat-containing protein 20 isoform X7 [Latimeria chalumnae]|eukprot:XP_005991420.1 PREDICTED: leucine-rich repeat-containing protein 20 isoform X7 [Latimeria chalumnae]
MLKIMGEAVAHVARKANETVENGKDCLELNLEGNYLCQLPEEVQTLVYLTSINLARNKFTEFPKPLIGVKALETINLEQNEITEVPVEKLVSMSSLKCLNLKSNPLDKEKLAASQPMIKFELLTTVEEAETLDQA